MANSDTPWGFKPLFMQEAQSTAMLLPITINYNTILGIQDPVTGVTAGTIERAPATGAILCCGVILGIYAQQTPYSLQISKLLPVQYYAASTATIQHFALVALDPNMFYAMQEDGDTTPLTDAMTFSNCDIIWTHTVNTTTGISKCEINSDTMAVTATLAVRLIRPWMEYYDIDAGAYNVTNSANSKWIVKINNYQFQANTLGLG